MSESRVVAATVYALSDPDGTPRYVGQTTRLVDRLARHWANRLHPEKLGNRRYAEWITSLDEKPVVTVLEVVSHEERLNAEARWIQQFLSQGHDLVNIHHRSGSLPVVGEKRGRTSWMRYTMVINIPMTRAMREEIDVIARARGVTRAAVMREVLEEWLERQKDEHPVSA